MAIHRAVVRAATRQNWFKEDWTGLENEAEDEQRQGSEGSFVHTVNKAMGSMELSPSVL